jgi:2-polyprenyl-3-methyl-5-hydroxy-6-metoxy-1,4-benzoquinol methylase
MLFPGPLKNIMRGSRGGRPNDGPPPAELAPLSQQRASETVTIRPSRGLEEFFGHIRDEAGLTILDLGAASQQNVSFITNLGHRLYSEDFVRLVHEAFGADDIAAQSNPGRMDYFLHQALDYPDQYFDGVLVWDVLEYLAPALVAAVIDRLCRIVRPKGYMLAFFHSDDKLDGVPFLVFRIQDSRMLQVGQSGNHKPAQLYNNRSLERMFSKAQSAKFFLTRDRLREVVVRL